MPASVLCRTLAFFHFFLTEMRSLLLVGYALFTVIKETTIDVMLINIGELDVLSNNSRAASNQVTLTIYEQVGEPWGGGGGGYLWKVGQVC